MIHYLFTFFIFSLISGFLALLTTILCFFKRKQKDYLKRIGWILCFFFLVVMNCIHFYRFNAGLEIVEFSKHMILGYIAIPFLTFLGPFYAHTLIIFPFSKIIEKSLLFIGIFSLIILIISLIFQENVKFRILFYFPAIIHIPVILYTCLVVIFSKKNQRNSTKQMANNLGICGLVLFPGLVFIDIFQNFQQEIIPNFSGGIFIVPFFFLFSNINFIISDIKVLLKKEPSVSFQMDLLKPFGLSSREEEVCELLLSGKKYNEITDLLFISMPTVKTHAMNIYEKCKVSGRVELMQFLLFPNKTDR